MIAETPFDFSIIISTGKDHLNPEHDLLDYGEAGWKISGIRRA
jgi:hypothetical protein